MGNNQKDFGQKNTQQKQSDKKSQNYEGSKQWSRKNAEDDQDLGKKDVAYNDNDLQDDDDDTDDQRF